MTHPELPERPAVQFENTPDADPGEGVDPPSYVDPALQEAKMTISGDDADEEKKAYDQRILDGIKAEHEKQQAEQRQRDQAQGGGQEGQFALLPGAETLSRHATKLLGSLGLLGYGQIGTA